MARSRAAAGFRVGTPSLPEPGLPEPGTSSPIAGEAVGVGGHHVLPQSIRQATSLRNPTFAYEHIQANRQTLTPVETQNREKTAIFKSEGLCIFGNRSQGCS